MLDPGEGFHRSYPAVAESVARARRELTEFARDAGAKGERLDAVRLAASEAVTNGIIHAYDRGGGAVEVTASALPGELWLFISDQGNGLQAGSPHGGLGLGLALIAQLADDLEIHNPSGGGTELRMQFKLDDDGGPSRLRGRQERGSVASAVVPA